MTPQLGPVLEIAGVGTVLLFLALVGLVGLMYLLTMPWPFARTARPADAPAGDGHEGAAITVVDDSQEQEKLAEEDRQLRAVALAVAVACAGAERSATVVTDSAAGWRHIHRSSRLGQPRARARVRT